MIPLQHISKEFGCRLNHRNPVDWFLLITQSQLKLNSEYSSTINFLAVSTSYTKLAIPMLMKSGKDKYSAMPSIISTGADDHIVME